MQLQQIDVHREGKHKKHISCVDFVHAYDRVVEREVIKRDLSIYLSIMHECPSKRARASPLPVGQVRLVSTERPAAGFDGSAAAGNNPT